MIIKTIRHNSDDYCKMIQLRIEVLLNPIGIPSSFINAENEKEDILIGAFEADMVGCCILTPVSSDIIQLRQMAVKKNQQGSGIGTALIKYTENLAKEKGFKTMMANSRDAVIPFYEKCGYRVIDKPFYEAGITHHKMQKVLGF